MMRIAAVLIACSTLALGGCAAEEPADPMSLAELRLYETYSNASDNLSLLCDEAPLNPREAAEAAGNAAVMLRAARKMLKDDDLSGFGVRDELHADAAFYDFCMPEISKQIRTGLNAFPPPPQIYEEAP